MKEQMKRKRKIRNMGWIFNWKKRLIKVNDKMFVWVEGTRLFFLGSIVWKTLILRYQPDTEKRFMQNDLRETPTWKKIKKVSLSTPISPSVPFKSFYQYVVLVNNLIFTLSSLYQNSLQIHIELKKVNCLFLRSCKNTWHLWNILT